MKLDIKKYTDSDNAKLTVDWEVGEHTGWFFVPQDRPIIQVVNQVSREVAEILANDLEV